MISCRGSRGTWADARPRRLCWQSHTGRMTGLLQASGCWLYTRDDLVCAFRFLGRGVQQRTGRCAASNVWRPLRAPHPGGGRRPDVRLAGERAADRGIDAATPLIIDVDATQGHRPLRAPSVVGVRRPRSDNHADRLTATSGDRAGRGACRASVSVASARLDTVISDRVRQGT